jgi:aspartate aminotransferase-like enzyme
MKLFVFPGNIEADILAAGAQDVPYARTADFGRRVIQCHDQLRGLLGARDAEILSFTASGTGAAEALLANWGPAWRSSLVIHGGTFGERWLEMGRRFGLSCSSIATTSGEPVDWERIRAALDDSRPQVVVAVHHETSTGELLDVARLGRLCAERSVRLVVDAIGSFLADEFLMSDWGVSAAFLSSQKGLSLPPGLSFLAVRPELGEPAENPVGFYFDLRKHRESFRRGQPPWSPAAQLYLQLERRLRKIDHAGGAPSQVAAVATKARHFRTEAMRLAGWHGFPDCPSNCLTSFRFTKPALDLVSALAREDFFVMPSADPCLVRIAHLGEATLKDHDELLARMRHFTRVLHLELSPQPHGLTSLRA